MKKQMQRLIAFGLLALIAATVLPGLACKKAEEPQQTAPPAQLGLEQTELEQRELNGRTYYVVPVEKHGSCLVRAECGLTNSSALAAAEALLADSGENDTAAVEKLLWADGEHIYLYGVRAMENPEEAAETDMIVLALTNDGGNWQAEEILPYTQSLSLFQRIVEETQPLRELTEEEMQEAVRLCYNRASAMKQRGEHAVSYVLSCECVQSDQAITSMEPIYSGEAGNIYHSPEKSNQVLAELLMRRTAEEENYSITDNPLVLFISQNGAFFLAAPSIDWEYQHQLIVSITQPLLPYLIKRDPETGELSGSVLENWTSIGFESEKQG